MAMDPAQITDGGPKADPENELASCKRLRPFKETSTLLSRSITLGALVASHLHCEQGERWAINSLTNVMNH